VKTVGLKMLKNKLSEYVRMAAGGETVLISDRGQVVAELSPPRETRSRELPDALLADAVRNGLVTPAVLPPGRPRAVPAVASWEDLARELDADRSDR
jgi:antitoxin (DNA-binding transcriptional repressor) of toxin-antitoxin stability system